MGSGRGLGKDSECYAELCAQGQKQRLPEDIKNQHVQMTVTHVSKLILYETAENGKNFDSLTIPFCSFFAKSTRVP